MYQPDRNARRGARLGALALSAALVLIAMPAEARLSDPGYGGSLSGGYFHGLPVRASAPPPSRPSDPEISGVAGANCRILRQTVQDRIGGTVLRTVQVCD